MFAKSWISLLYPMRHIKFVESRLDCKHYSFDLFKQLRLKLEENLLSDIIAATLKLPFGKSILIALRKSEWTKDKNAENIINIFENTDKCDINIFRECKEDTPQTEREWGDPIAFIKKRNIPGGNVLAFFVSPEGSKASSDKFHAPSRYTLNNIICNECFPRPGIFEFSTPET